MRAGAALLLGWLSALLAAGAAAQTASSGAQPPLAHPTSASGDSGVEYFAPAGPFARVGLAPYLDLRLGYDQVHHRPGATRDLETQRATLRAGLVWARAGAPLRIEAGARASLGGESNRDAVLAFRNELPDTVELDLLGWRFAPRGGEVLTGGKARLPFRLSEMVWDDDLRPVGLALASRPLGTSRDAVRFGAGAFTRSRFDPDDGQVAIGQVAGRFRQDAPAGGEVALSYLLFGNLNELARDLLARQNRTVSGPSGLRYAADFELLELQMGARAVWGIVPLSANATLARNLAAEAEGDAFRVRMALGGAGLPAGLEVGWILQRVEREAVVGAFNSDDWWFHSRSRGQQVWVRFGEPPWPEVRLAGFVERRDDLVRHTRRLTVELRFRRAAL